MAFKYGLKQSMSKENPFIWPPEIALIICIVTLHATWNDLGFSIFTPFIIVPFSNISLRLI